jgi:O-antigen ligase
LVIYALKLLFPVLVVCGLAWGALRASFAPLLTKSEYARAWFVMSVGTIIVFLAHSTMLYAMGIAMVALFAQAYLGGGIRGKLAAFMLLIMILPPLTWQVGGIGDINYVLGLTGPRILALVLLSGPALKLLGDRTYKRERWVTPLDLAVFAYQLLKIALMVPHSTTSGLLRLMVESVLDVLLPYYVVSRAIRTEADLRFQLSHLALGFVLAAAVGFTEYFVHRNFYSELQWLYGYKWQLTMTLMRGDHLRVQAATPTPIVLAFEMLFAIGIWTYLRGHDWRRWPVLAVYALLGCCLAFTFSRGPWLCGIVFGLSLLGLRKMAVKAFVSLFLLLLAGAVVVKMLGADQAVIRALSAVFGSSEADLSSINYRNELLDTALALLRQSPWLGVPDYASQMQALRQGEGIIDLVNSYIGIALDTGVIGLVIYLLPYVFAFRRMVKVPGLSLREPGDANAGWFTATFLAMIIALLLTIFTTSTFFTMPFLLVSLLALPIARLSMKTTPVDIALDLAPAKGLDLHGYPLTGR